MLRHVVLLSFVDHVEDRSLDAIVERLRGLPEIVDTIRSYEVARDLGLAPANAQVVVTADFDDVAGWEHYRDHPEHRRVIDELIAPVLSDRRAAQFAC